MSLRKNAPATAAAFESEEVTQAEAQETAVDKKAVETAVDAKVNKTEVIDADGVIETVTKVTEAPAANLPAVQSEARTQGGLVMARGNAIKNVLLDNKDLFRIDWDSLPRISAEQGEFLFKDDTNEELGPNIELKLVSYQDNYVASPGDNKAPIDLVKWSPDGITAQDGTDMKAHIEFLKEEGYSKARISHRQVTVCELLTVGGKVHERSEDLVQLDLPESGRRSFNTHNLQASYKVSKGSITEEQAAMMQLAAVKMKTKAGESYTKISIGLLKTKAD